MVPGGLQPVRRRQRPTLLVGLAASVAVLVPHVALAQSVVREFSTSQAGIAYGLAANVLRLPNDSLPFRDFTVAGQFTARNAAGADHWAFGTAAEAWALPGSRSLLIGSEHAVINEEPTNAYPKVASSAVFKNRADGAPDPGTPMNLNSTAFWVSAQPGTGFERGLAFDRYSLSGTRPAAIDLSDLSDEAVAQIDLIRIRKGVSLRYDPRSRELYLFKSSPE